MTKRISVGIRGKADRKRERIGSGDESSRAPFLFGIAAPLPLINPAGGGVRFAASSTA
jgi:hypothetical protein